MLLARKWRVDTVSNTDAGVSLQRLLNQLREDGFNIEFITEFANEYTVVSITSL